MKKLRRLSDLPEQARGVFIALDGDGSARLRDMGLLPGETLGVIQNSGHGPVTVMLKGSAVAIGHALARRIVIRET